MPRILQEDICESLYSVPAIIEKKPLLYIEDNIERLYISNTQYLNGDIIFIPSENKFMIYFEDQKFIEVKIHTDEERAPNGISIDGVQYNIINDDSKLISNIIGSSLHYVTSPDDMHKLI